MPSNEATSASPSSGSDKENAGSRAPNANVNIDPTAFLGKISRTATDLHESIVSGALRTARNTLFTTPDDFARMHPSSQRMLVIGCTGAGKSTILNIMAGWRYVQRPPDYEFVWEAPAEGDEAPLFEAGEGTDSVTRRTAFANLNWFGDAKRSFVAVDSPGHDDPSGADIDSPEAREKLGELAADLHNKLKAMRHVNTILVLHNDVLSNRLNPATYTILKAAREPRSIPSPRAPTHRRTRCQT